MESEPTVAPVVDPVATRLDVHELYELRDIRLLLKAAFHEALAFPGNINEILERLIKEAEKLHQSYVQEVRFAEEAEQKARSWAAKYHMKWKLTQSATRAKMFSVLRGMGQEDSTNGINPHGFFVYLLWPKIGKPIYIGKSRNVFGRIGFHVTAEYGQEISRVTFIRCTNEVHMDMTEQELIRHYKPKLNIQYNFAYHNSARGNMLHD